MKYPFRVFYPSPNHDLDHGPMAYRICDTLSEALRVKRQLVQGFGIQPGQVLVFNDRDRFDTYVVHYRILGYFEGRTLPGTESPIFSLSPTNAKRFETPEEAREAADKYKGDYYDLQVRAYDPQTKTCMDT